jgi:transposase
MPQRRLLRRQTRRSKKGFVLPPNRWVVERSFAWMTRCRGLVLQGVGKLLAERPITVPEKSRRCFPCASQLNFLGSKITAGRD